MTEKIYAPQVDNFISRLGNRNRGGFNNNCTFTEESYKLIDRFFDLLKRISPVSENGCRELWFCIDRGTIENFGDYEEMHEMGEVESFDEFKQLWEDYYPKEKKWYYVEAVHDEEIDYKAVTVDHKFVIVVDPRAERGYEHDIAVFAEWLCDETEKCIKQMEKAHIWISSVQIFRSNIEQEQ